MNAVFTPDERTMESLWPPTGQWPRRWPTDFRKLMFWIFAATALIFTPFILYTVPRPHPVSLLRNLLNGPIPHGCDFCGGGVECMERKNLGESLGNCRISFFPLARFAPQFFGQCEHKLL